MRLPPLTALRAFEASARLLSFSRAGDELHVTHAAISHQIKQLEAWFGTPLFRREGRGVGLTAVGKTVAAGITPAFTDIADICRRARVGQGRRRLAVGCIPSIASRWLVPNLPQFFRNHPEIELQVLYARAQTRLADGNCDVLITLGEDAATSASNQRVFSRASRPVCSPHYLDSRGRAGLEVDIGSANLLHDETQAGWRDWFRAAGIAAPADLPGTVFEDFNLLATAVIAGQGVALCPTDIFRNELSRGDLIVLSDVAILGDAGYFMITEKQPNAEALKFMDWFRSVASSPADPCQA